MKNVSFHDLQFDSSLTSLIALESTQNPEHCFGPILSPFRCRRDTAIHGDGKPPWEVYSPSAWPQWPPSSIVTQRQCLGLRRAPEKAFEQIKQTLVSPTVLAHYNPNRPTIISADASNTGLGEVLFQVQVDGQSRPVRYVSRSLCDTEKRERERPCYDTNLIAFQMKITLLSC